MAPERRMMASKNTSMIDKEKIEVLSDEGSFAEEDLNEPDQNDMPEWIEPYKLMTTETRRGGHRNTSLRYNRYGDDFLIDKIKPYEIGADLLSMGDLVLEKEWQIINDNEDLWQEDHTVPEQEMDLKQSETEKRDYTNLRIPEWILGMPGDENERQSNQ